MECKLNQGEFPTILTIIASKCEVPEECDEIEKAASRNSECGFLCSI